MGPFYADLCSSAIDKMSYPSAARFGEYDKEQKELFSRYTRLHLRCSFGERFMELMLHFLRYRMTRSEVSIDAYFMMGKATLKFLNHQLEEAVDKGDLCR